MYESIYLLQTRESIKNDEHVYKIGRTCQDELKRFNEYPKGSVLHLHVSCYNSVCVERRILERFNRQFRNDPVYGSEYFHGDLLQMLAIVCDEVSLSFDCTHNSQNFCESLQRVKNDAARTVASHEQKCATLAKQNEQLVKLVANLKAQVSELTAKTKDEVDGNADGEDEVDEDEVMPEDEIESLLEGSVSMDVIKCSKCNRQFTRLDNMKVHERKCKGLINPKQCEICLKIFTSTSGKWKHNKNVKCSPPPPPPSTEVAV